jgi:BMFP domain-containing protein YqiC
MAMKDQGSGRARVMDDLAGMAGGAFSVLTGIRSEIEAIAKAQVEAVVRRFDLVRREELDAAMDVARRAREQAEDLAARVEALEARSTPKSSGKSSSKN